MRWDVEVKPDVFHDVGAIDLRIESGTLIFVDPDDRVMVAYGPGHWITVAATSDEVKP